MKRLIIILAAVCMAFMGCAKPEKSANEQAMYIIGEKYPLTVVDYNKHETVLTELPKRIAVVAGTPLNIWYDMDGKSVCTPNINEEIQKLVVRYRDEMIQLPTVGAVYSLNMEALIEQKPDLVIAQAGVQNSQIKALREMGIPVIATLTRSFEDVLELYGIFGKLLENEELAEKRITELKESRQQYIEKVPNDGKSIVVLYLTASSLSVKLDNSIAGEIARSLSLKNIASDLPPDTIGSETTPLDIEYLVQQNPDMVLVTSMVGSNELAVETMEKHFRDNQAWQSIPAIIEGRIAYLPQEYFLYNAGPYYDEAVHYMACAVYPEIFGEVSEWYGK